MKRELEPTDRREKDLGHEWTFHPALFPKGSEHCMEQEGRHHIGQEYIAGQHNQVICIHCGALCGIWVPKP